MAHDLAVIVVSTNEAGWLPACLASLRAHAGDIALDVVVADNASTDGTTQAALAVPGTRVVQCRNHGFSHANNRAWLTCDARYALFLNPDTELVEGTLEALIRRLDELPGVGMAGLRQLDPAGGTWPSMRRMPSVRRQAAQALGSDHWPGRLPWAKERETDLSRYGEEFDLDWTSGSAMLLRREALESAGLMDERSFLYSEEPDLAFRLRAAGWRTRHLPQLALVHHAGKAGWTRRVHVQYAVARRHYAHKHMGPLRRAAYLGASGIGLCLRSLAFATVRRGAPEAAEARVALRAALGGLAGRIPSPYEPVGPQVAVRRREDSPVVLFGPETAR